MSVRRTEVTGEWKRTVAGALDRLEVCEDGMERTRGECINLQWYHWMGEWSEAFEWLQKRAPRIARRMVAEAETGR